MNLPGVAARYHQCLLAIRPASYNGFMSWIERCRSCNRPFSIEQQDPKEVAAEMQADIDCPHCNDVWGSHNQLVNTSALTAEQELAFHKGELKSDR
jgi:hypothetical protein